MSKEIVEIDSKLKRGEKVRNSIENSKRWGIFKILLKTKINIPLSFNYTIYNEHF